MSLVNEMLRDLDARRDRLSVDSALNGLNPAPIESSRPAYAHWLLVPVLAAIVGIAAWLLFSQTLNRSAIPEEYVASQAVTSEPANTAPETIAEPVQPAKPVENKSASMIETATTESIMQEAAASESVSEPVAKAQPEPPAPTITKKPRTLSPAERAEQLYAQAVAAFNRGDMRRAEDLLNESLALSADHIRAREQLAMLLIMQQRQREAEQILRAGLAIDATQANMALQLGQLLAQQNRAIEAIGIMEPALLNAADNPQFLGTLAGIYQNAGEPQLAINNYQAALSLRPNQSVWWMGLGISLEQTGQYDKAVAAYQEALTKQRLRPDLRTYVSERLAVLQPAAEIRQ